MHWTLGHGDFGRRGSSPPKYRQWLNILYKTRLGAVRGAKLTHFPSCIKRKDEGIGIACNFNGNM